ncbi:MAG: MraY family glycosyltransferase [Phycisphaerae bacterium]
MALLPEYLSAWQSIAIVAPQWADQLFWLLAAAVIATLATGPLVQRVAVAGSLYDHPDDGLKPHDKPIPYLGGIAIYAGWLVAILLAMVIHPAMRSVGAWILIGGSVLLLTGLIDDIRHLRPTTRLAIQALVAIALLFAGIGRGITSALWDPIFPFLQETGSDGFGFATDAILCIVVLAGAVNATNLIDGLDGLCSGTLAIAAIGFLAVFALLSGGGRTEWDGLVVPVISIGMLGACLGFLKYNFNPASLFMGDSGSMLLGFSVATIILRLTEMAAWQGLIASIIVFGFPIFDMALAVARRALNRRPLFIGDRSHFYDQVRDRGLSVRRTVLLCYLLAFLFAVLGALITCLPNTLLWTVFAVLPLIASFSCWRYGLLRVDHSAERSSPSTD